MYGFKMLCVHKKSCKFISVKLKSEQCTDTYIINSALHCSVHSLCVISVIVLGSCRVQALIALLVIGFLKQYICADSRLFQLSVVFYRRSGNVYVYSADSAVLVLDGVNSLDTFEYVFKRVVHRVFACLYGKSFVTHVL